MIIECTSCHARAKLPDSKEGAKVRCPQCGHIYVARPPGARPGGRGRSSDSPAKVFLIGGVVLVMGILVVLFRKGDDGRGQAPVVQASGPVERPGRVSAMGWDSPLVQQACLMHETVAGRNTSKLYVAIDFPRAYEGRRPDANGAANGAADGAADGAASEAADGAGAPDDDLVAAAPLRPWGDLSAAEQTEFKNGLVDDLVQGTGRELIAEWEPYDGSVVAEDDEQAVVRLRVQYRDTSVEVEDRWVEWRFARSGSKWLAWHWERWISPDEIKAERRTRRRKTVRRTLSDGSEVIESESREITYHEETSPELRQEIEQLIDKMLDPELRPREITAARLRLEEIGKHAVPGLLTRMSVIALDSEEHAILLQQIHLLLQDITGYYTTFDVHAAMGTTRERQESGLKQWYGWYDRKWKKFWRAGGPPEEEDPFWDDPDFQPRNEKERREFEELRREHEAEKKKKDG